jgi:hypothetical protein
VLRRLLCRRLVVLVLVLALLRRGAGLGAQASQLAVEVEQAHGLPPAAARFIAVDSKIFPEAQSRGCVCA